MLHRHVGGDEFHDLGIDLELRQVHGRHLELPRQDLGDLEFGDEAELDEVVAHPRAVLLLLGERLLQLLLGDEPLAEEEVTEAFGAGGGGVSHLATEGSR